MECHVMHNAKSSPQRTGNQLLLQMMGVKQLFIGEVSDTERGDRLQEYAAQQSALGRRPYIVADPVLGAMGYVSAALELHQQAEQNRIDLRHLFIAGSMGPTEAGLLWGAALMGKSLTVHAPTVEYPADELRERMLKICSGISTRLGFNSAVDPEELLHIDDRFLGAGYDIPTRESIQAARELAATEGIFIETTYNAKVFACLKEMLQQGAIPKDEGICIFHSGGIPALFGQGERFAEFLE